MKWNMNLTEIIRLILLTATNTTDLFDTFNINALYSTSNVIKTPKNMR